MVYEFPPMGIIELNHYMNGNFKEKIQNIMQQTYAAKCGELIKVRGKPGLFRAGKDSAAAKGGLNI